MKVLKNASLCILFPLMLWAGMPIMYTNDVILTDDDFEIVATSGSQGGHGGDDICSTAIQIKKSHKASTPEYVTLSATAKSSYNTTQQQITISNFTNQSDSYLIESVTFDGLLEGHMGECIVYYYIEVYLYDQVVRDWYTEVLDVHKVCLTN